MPKAFTPEFRADVVAVARAREKGVALAQIAADFDISESCLHRWLKVDDVDAGPKPGVTTQEAADNRELPKRVKLLEQENEVLRRAAAYLGQAHLPKA